MSHYRLRQSAFKLQILIGILLSVIVGATRADDQQRTTTTATVEHKRPATVVDAIAMTQIADPRHVVCFSPDRTKLLVVVKAGNLQHNTNEFSLLLWRTDQIMTSPAPRLLLALASTSNRDAIEKVSWLDNDTILFLGEHSGELHQLYMLSTGSRVPRRLTNSATNVLSYSVSADHKKVLYSAERPEKSVFTEKNGEGSVTVSNQWLAELVVGHTLANSNAEEELWVANFGREGLATKVMDSVAMFSRYNPPLLGPDGRTALLHVQVRDIPASWKGYSDRFLQQFSLHGITQFSQLAQYALVDIQTGAMVPILNAPLPLAKPSQAIWLPDGKSVVITNTYLPLGDVGAHERKLRSHTTFTVEIDTKSKAVQKIAAGSFTLLSWDARTGDLELMNNGAGAGDSKQARETYRKVNGRWAKAAVAPQPPTGPVVRLEEDMAAPPRLIATDAATGKTAMLLNLNPQVASLALGRVEDVAWEGSDGHRVKGGLYFPVGYVPGAKYPVVIQTHGWNAKKFWLDGPFSTAFAAQPMAGRGMVVLQVDEIWYGPDFNTPQEVDREVGAYEGAIEYLDRRGLIDRSRVGLIGFSRTCLFAKYALTHSKYKFAAASINGGVDGGYFQYLAAGGPANLGYMSGMEEVIGGLPWGAGITSWLKESPGFHLDRVVTPVLIIAETPQVGLWEWEWFAGLSRLGKAVEMVVMKDGEHELKKPADRVTSLQGNVDWFDFWLKGHEDPDRAKAQQYRRWEQLCDMQVEHNPRQAAFCVRSTSYSRAKPVGSPPETHSIIDSSGSDADIRIKTNRRTS